MTQRSAYLQYRASAELDGLVADYIRDMEGPYASTAGKADAARVIRIMDLFVAESVDAIALDAADAIGIGPRNRKVINGIAGLAKSTGSMLIGRVVKGFSAEQHQRLAAYMKRLRIVAIEDGEEVGLISFPLRADVAEQGWATGRLAIESGGEDPRLVAEARQFLHTMAEVAMFWVFEEPVRRIGLSGVTATLAGGAVRSVRKSALLGIDQLIPRAKPHQLAIAAEYFATLLQPGPYLAEFGEVTVPGFFSPRESAENAAT